MFPRSIGPERCELLNDDEKNRRRDRRLFLATIVVQLPVLLFPQLRWRGVRRVRDARLEQLFSSKYSKPLFFIVD